LQKWANANFAVSTQPFFKDNNNNNNKPPT
jgi:hypothetical protein